MMYDGTRKREREGETTWRRQTDWDGSITNVPMMLFQQCGSPIKESHSGTKIKVKACCWWNSSKSKKISWVATFPCLFLILLFPSLLCCLVLVLLLMLVAAMVGLSLFSIRSDTISLSHHLPIFPCRSTYFLFPTPHHHNKQTGFNKTHSNLLPMYPFHHDYKRQ